MTVMLVIGSLILPVILLLPGNVIRYLIGSSKSKYSKTNGIRNKNKAETARCWMKDAFRSKEFILFSHRSFADDTHLQQPSCEDSLLELKQLGVNHLDLDLVLDIDSSTNIRRLMVGHPMEYKHITKQYSPCANTEFNDMIQILTRVFGDDFFISLEPKAAWKNTQHELEDPALTNLPSRILKQLHDDVERNFILKDKCGVIVDTTYIYSESTSSSTPHSHEEVEQQRNYLSGILEYCTLFKGIGIKDEPPVLMGNYDMLMPTIEFHPSHPSNTRSKAVPTELNSKSIYWVVDNEENLQFAADLRPKGIVSNSPKTIIEILNSPDWCPIVQ